MIWFCRDLAHVGKARIAILGDSDASKPGLTTKEIEPVYFIVVTGISLRSAVSPDTCTAHGSFRYAKRLAGVNSCIVQRIDPGQNILYSNSTFTMVFDGNRPPSRSSLEYDPRKRRRKSWLAKNVWFHLRCSSYSNIYGNLPVDYRVNYTAM